jgi:hypothetical protein
MRDIRTSGSTRGERNAQYVSSALLLYRFHGQEAADETPAASHRQLHRAPPQPGIQAAR